MSALTDAMAAAAMARITQQINRSATTQRAQIHLNFQTLRLRIFLRREIVMPMCGPLQRLAKDFTMLGGAMGGLSQATNIFSTTGSLGFFKDADRNRRFWPIEVPTLHRRSVRSYLADAGDTAVMAASAIGLALLAGGLGPWLDAQPDRRSEAIEAEQLQVTQRLAERWDRETRAKCAAIGGDNTGYIRTVNGGIACTDKRGRQLAQKGQP